MSRTKTGASLNEQSDLFGSFGPWTWSETLWVVSLALGAVTAWLVIRVREPATAMREGMRDALEDVYFLENVAFNPCPSGNVAIEAHNKFRAQSSAIKAYCDHVPFYPFVSKVFGLPSFKDIDWATTKLIFLANTIALASNPNAPTVEAHLNKHHDDYQRLKKILGMRTES